MHANCNTIEPNIPRSAHLIRVFGETLRQVVPMLVFGVYE
tara:strand:+ start:23 stop:142 length:120 start_codon:yes stop_codon:yes gene_type:complete